MAARSFCLLFIISLFFLFLGRTQGISHTYTLKPFYYISSAGSCVAANFTSCCSYATSPSCVVSQLIPNCVNYSLSLFLSLFLSLSLSLSQGSGGDCYCDKQCHIYNDCCSDIDSIGCTYTESSCVAANYSGCCTGSSCQGTGGDSSCYCDSLCYFVGDCCTDIASIGCYQNQTNSTSGNINIVGYC